jgi:hypothetical protein
LHFAALKNCLLELMVRHAVSALPPSCKHVVFIHFSKKIERFQNNFEASTIW